MNKKISSAELQALVTKADDNVTEARAQWQSAKDKLDADFPALSAAGDEAGIVRLRKAVKGALAAFEDARDGSARLNSQLQRALQADAAIDTARRIADAKSKGLVWAIKAETVQEAAAKLWAAIEEMTAAGLDFRTALPSGINESELTMLWSPTTLASHVQLYLYGLSGGAFGRGSGASPWQVVQGADIRAKVNENITRALAKQPKTQPEPPVAA